MNPGSGETPCFKNPLRILTTGLVAVPGGFLFSLLHIPLPWMLGPLTVSLIHHNVSAWGTLWPTGLRNAAMIVIGYSMGRTATMETAHQILVNLPWMVAVTAATILFGLAAGYITHRRTGISLSSGILGSVPGGWSQMILVAEEIEDADLSAVTLMQMIRVMAVLFIVPFIATHGIAHMPAELPLGMVPNENPVPPWPTLLMVFLGVLLAVRLKFPIPFLLGPVFGTLAAVLTGFATPRVCAPVMNGAQLFFGVYLGCIMSLKSLRKIVHVLPWAVGGSLALVAFTYLMGFVLMLVTPASMLTAFLSTAPGGLTELGIVALTLGADVTFFLAFQLFRLFFILLAAPMLLKRRFQR